jgi:hypothetical protein
VQFQTKFAHKVNAVEIVTMMLQDGTWKVTERRDASCSIASHKKRLKYKLSGGRR